LSKKAAKIFDLDPWKPIKPEFWDKHKALTQLMKLHFQYLKYFAVLGLRLNDVHCLLFPSIFNQDTLITSLHRSVLDIRSEFMQ